MYCLNCGAQAKDGDTFCPVCGSSRLSADTASQSTTIQNTNAAPMKWFYFLIYFSLFASAILNAINGFQMLTGAHYQGQAELVYAFFGGLQTLDIIVGLGSLGIAVLAIYTRFRLAGYFQNGPKMVMLTYAANAVILLVYVLGLQVLLPGSFNEYMNYTSQYISVAVSAVMIFVNKAYFDKRADLFTK